MDQRKAYEKMRVKKFKARIKTINKPTRMGYTYLCIIRVREEKDDKRL